MKANWKAKMGLLAAIFMGLTSFSQGNHNHNRHNRDARYENKYKQGNEKGYENKYRQEKDDRYEDKYRQEKYDRNRNNDDYRVVKNMPQAVYHAKNPRRPSPHHIWIPGEYNWNRGGYVYMPGYWVKPPQPGLQYVPGYWQPSRGGYAWVSGFWQGVHFNKGWRN